MRQSVTALLPHPEERALARVSKDGPGPQYMGPSFETPCRARLLRMRSKGICGHSKTRQHPLCESRDPRGAAWRLLVVAFGEVEADGLDAAALRHRIDHKI